MRGGLQGVSAVLIITLVQGSLSMYENKRRVFNHKPFARNEPVHIHAVCFGQCCVLFKHHSWWPHVRGGTCMWRFWRTTHQLKAPRNKSCVSQPTRYITMPLFKAWRGANTAAGGHFTLCVSLIHTHTCAHVRTLNADLQQNTVRL